MADGWEAFPEAGGADGARAVAADPWAAFPAADTMPAAGDQPARITVRPEPTRADAALNLPVAYEQLVKSGLGAMSAGAGDVAEGARGLVNPDADRSPRGPIPISARLKAVGDILGGLGKTVAGGLEYGTAPLMAPVRAVASQPLENVVGVPREYTEFAAGMATPLPSNVPIPRGGRPAVRSPTTAELGADASRGYQAPEVTNFMARPQAATRLQDEILTDLGKAGAVDVTAPTVYRLIGMLDQPPGAVGFSADNLEKFRQQLGKIGPVKDGTGRVTNGEELRAAAIARSRVDQFMRSVQPSEVISGDAIKAADTLEEARANFAAKEAAETINRKEFRAELRAAAANSGQNVSNTMRQRIADILLDPAARRGFSAQEIALMDRIVRGTRGENTVRFAGNAMGGGGGWGSAATATAGGLIFGPAGATIPLVGYGLKALSNVMTARNIERLNEIIRADSPLGRKMAAPLQNWSQAAQQFQISPNARNFARLTISSRNLSNNLADGGIKMRPDDLLRAASPSPDGQPSEQ